MARGRVLLYAALIYFLPPIVSLMLAPAHACMAMSDDPIRCMSHWEVVSDAIKGLTPIDPEGRMAPR